MKNFFSHARPDLVINSKRRERLQAPFTYIPDVFTGGGEFNTAGFIVGKFWKNGIPTAVSDGTKTVFISCMVVSDSDVYMSGYEAGANGSNNIAKYWKNSTAIALSDGSHSATAGSMVVVGNDVYVAGTESNGTKDVAKYWKNGVATVITNDASDVAAGALLCVDLLL